ncbi:hypothetical protein, partial [Pseudoalteromonas sp.]|uniref:hypothetical protein n=1 Tax=Pseudoalteromonas sp. TaxID=53249 RepID=UPI00260DD804
DNHNPPILAVRYIDDIFVANFLQFLTYASKIYGNDLQLDVTSNGQTCNFLDLHIKLKPIHRLPLISVYNKTDAFPFKVNRYTYPDSMISNKVHSTIIATQLIRFARITTQYQQFVLKCKEFFKTLSQQWFEREFLISQLLRFVSGNEALLLKYFVPTKAAIARFAIDLFGGA